MRERELGDRFGDELAREAAVFLEAVELVEESRSERCATRLLDYLRHPSTREASRWTPA